ncbi:MAG: hypothetical protein ACYC40_03275 [Patescibacteria group bacterium]
MENFLTKEDLLLSLQKEAEGIVKKRLKFIQLIASCVLIVTLFFSLKFFLQSLSSSTIIIHPWLDVVVLIVLSSLITIFLPVGKIKPEWITDAFYELSNRRAAKCINEVNIFYQKLCELENEIRLSDEIFTSNEVSNYLERLQEQFKRIGELQIENQLFKEILSENLKKIKEDSRYN